MSGAESIPSSRAYQRGHEKRETPVSSKKLRNVWRWTRPWARCLSPSPLLALLQGSMGDMPVIDLTCRVIFVKGPPAAGEISAHSCTMPSDSRHAGTSRNQGRYRQEQIPPSRTSNHSLSSYAPNSHTFAIAGHRSGLDALHASHRWPPPTLCPQLEAGHTGSMAPGSSTGIQAGILIPTLPVLPAEGTCGMSGDPGRCRPGSPEPGERGCVRTTGQYLSHLFTVPKKDGTRRPVVNLKPLNAHIQRRHFKMEGTHRIY